MDRRKSRGEEDDDDSDDAENDPDFVPSEEDEEAPIADAAESEAAKHEAAKHEAAENEAMDSRGALLWQQLLASSSALNQNTIDTDPSLSSSSSSSLSSSSLSSSSLTSSSLSSSLSSSSSSHADSTPSSTPAAVPVSAELPSCAAASPKRALPEISAGVFRPAAKKSRLSELVGQLGGRSKVSTLQKSSQDWMQFKKAASIEHDMKFSLQTGFLAQQSFLLHSQLKEHTSYLQGKKP